ncbi:hypothetical protein [Mesorhizobium sp. M0488]|uniref:hypothetical protein n=1 Tax=unclassified Mesorhizobium TaxID=325217 RepID=UPI00333B719B
MQRHGRPERIAIDGSQTNHEAIRPCDLESPAASIATSTEVDQHPQDPVFQQPHRAGS